MKNFVLLFSLFSSFLAFSFEAVVIQLRGDVIIDSKSAKIGDKLVEGQVIEAKNNKSFFVAEYTDGTKFMIKNAKLKIIKVTEKSSIINLDKGSIFVKVKPSKKQEFKKLIIKTRTASMGVRGTMFFVTEEEDNSYLCVCEGKVEVVNNQGISEILSKYEDINVSESKSMKKRPANQQMISMGEDIFKTF